ncbi:hypothetical protein LEP1GSC202_0437 [Leptospira yanagawae serovar Saopaulo str. Sao Paulo = ATCC 700523]|uniref:Uncharacterized protein n=1 Tax=Leptospira yanagawae serovar Saopaulo str. Sao Paulo = ATCC 700523 TaxID=1249483 RepID=A0A5E8HIM1_9LEPT|nr:hypothetical protein [Leptospira yanagawae]EOQ90747.1 hypothetical protein LEP1GSC202_0437 [Leptospira yanagawae serovar Saopaulo str. Sao Paulo = ATCC 700523]
MLEYGKIFTEITKKTVPKSVEESWDAVTKTKGIRDTKIREVGSNLTPMRGNVFPISNLTTDIDKYL